MRKIKELEARIDRLERTRNYDNEACADRYERNREWLMDIEEKQKEQEKFLKNTVAPFIADALIEELGKGMAGIADALADSFAEEPKKTKKRAKGRKKVGRPKQKKENK